MTENFWYNSHSLKEYETICTSLQSYDTNNTNIIMCKYIFLSQKLTPPVFCRKREYITDRDIWTLFKYALSESPTTDNMLFRVFFKPCSDDSALGVISGDKITANDGNADYNRPQTKFAKVMFLQVSVILSTGGRGMRGCSRGHVWFRGCVHGKGGHVWWRGGMCGKGGHAWQRGACVAKGRHAW